MVDAKYFSYEYLSQIRQEFWKLSQGADLVIEKTAANCLRIDFLKVLFPHAEFVFVQRECLQVVKSVLKKQNGNINKVSNAHRVTLRMRIFLLVDRVRSKFLSIKHTPASLIDLATKNFDNILNILNLKSDIHWGPKFCSKDVRRMIRHPEIYAFLQWAACDAEIVRVKDNNSANDHFLEFQEIIDNPVNCAMQLEKFLDCVNLLFEIDPRSDTFVGSGDLVFYNLIKLLSKSNL